MTKTFYIIDGHAQIYRAYYAPFRDLNSPSGEPTRATHVFCQMLLNILRDKKPDYIAMVLDVSDETVFRRQIDPQYKAHRDEPPLDFDVQANRIVQIVQEMGVPIFKLAGYEADDLVATMVERLSGQDDLHIYIVSKDKDLEQILTAQTSLYDPAKNDVLRADMLLELKGYTPAQAVDIQTLTGDTTDNVPGIKGIGLKTAAKLVQMYGSAEGVLANADKLTPKQAENVKAYAAQLPITQQLVTLKRDVPFDFDLPVCASDRLQLANALPIFRELGFGKLTDTLKTMAGIEPAASDNKPVTSTPKSQVNRASSVKVGGQFDLFGGGEEGEASGAGGAYSSHEDYQLINTKEKFDAFLVMLRQQSIFAFDTETTGLHPIDADLVGLSFSWQAGQGYYIAVRSAYGEVVEEAYVVEQLRPVMEDAGIKKVGHNIKYDLLVLKQLGIPVRGVFFDTMIASFVIDAMRRSHGMDNLCKALFDHDMIPITDLIGKGKDQITMDLAPIEQVTVYAAEDADYTWRMYERFSEELKDNRLASLFHELEMPLVEVLATMEFNGTAIDVKVLKKLSDELAVRIDAIQDDIFRHAGHPFNVDSPKQLATVLFDEQGLTAVRKTKTGRSTDSDTLEALASSSKNPIPPLVQEYREFTKLKGTYLDTLPTMVSRRSGRIHTSFHQTGAVTGRLSSSDPNLQNIPIRTDTGRQIRKAFVASTPDALLLTADYSQVELRLLAHLCQDKALMDTFRQGLDVHRAVAAEVNGVSLEHVTSAQRSAAKAVNFGIIYGQTAFGLSRTINISVDEAKKFIDTYFDRYPGIRKFIDDRVAKAKSAGFAETILGRRRPIAELASSNKQQYALGERLAVNTVVQGSAADLIKRAMINLHRSIVEGSIDARMVIQVHDELVFEVPASNVEAVSQQITHAMENALPLTVPIVVDVAWGKNWYEGK